MDAVDLWLLRYEPIHTSVTDDLVESLTEAQVRGRPVPGVNPIAWLIWHAMRIEDVCVNRFVLDRPQVLDAGWTPRLRVSRCDVGTGMTDAQVDALCEAVDVEQLRGYCRAVTRATLDAAPLLRGLDLEVSVPAERVTRVCTEEGAVDPGRHLAHRVLGRRPKPRVDRRADLAAPRLRPLLRGARDQGPLGRAQPLDPER